MTQVRNASGAEEKIQIQQTIFNQEGKLVATKESTALVRASSAQGSRSYHPTYKSKEMGYFGSSSLHTYNNY